MIERLVRAIRFDASVYAEVAEDENALSQAAIIVIAAAFLSALGAAIGSGSFLGTFIVTLLLGVLIWWALWAVMAYLIGTMLFGGDTDVPEMLRVLGYASWPQAIGVIGFIPCLGPLAGIIGFVLAAVAGVIAVREAMEFDTGKAVLTVIIAWIISLVIGLVISAIFLGGAAVLGGLAG